MKIHAKWIVTGFPGLSDPDLPLYCPCLPNQGWYLPSFAPQHFLPLSDNNLALQGSEGL